MKENGVVTIFRRNDGASGLLCMGTFPAWIHREESVRNDGAGMHQDDRFDVRIKTEYIPDIQTGDLIFFGRAESACVKASECRRIAVATFNGFGSFPHWHLRSEYRYG
ncbi:MAG: hypothetical protein Q4A86_00925 [Clostridia bacterium]|nr:hypothetical protein [Clostridia bacterium]